MSSLNGLQVRNLLASGEVRQVGTDSPVAIRLKYVGTGTVTSVTVTTATNIVMVTSDGGTDTYAFSTYATVGALVDAINADGIFKAKVLDTVRSEATASQFVTGAITAAAEDGTMYYDVKVDTNAANYFAVRLTNNRGFEREELNKSHRVHLDEIVYLMNLATASANNVKVYKVNGTTETVVYQGLPVDNTETTINFASGQGRLSGKNGEDIVVKIDDGGTLADAAGNLLRVVGTLE